MLVLVEIGVFMLVVDLLNLLIHFILYLSSWLYACYLLMVSLWGLTLVFASLGIMVEYSCLNTGLYNLWSTLILISCMASHYSLNLCLMSSLPKGERMCTKLVELFLLIGGWEKKHDKFYLIGELALRVLGELSLSFSLLFLWFATFLIICWFCGLFFF
jgi:hypothetical protein